MPIYLLMNEDHGGARAGDVVGFEDPAEAQALVEAGKAQPAEPPRAQ